MSCSAISLESESNISLSFSKSVFFIASNNSITACSGPFFEHPTKLNANIDINNIAIILFFIFSPPKNNLVNIITSILKICN